MKIADEVYLYCTDRLSHADWAYSIGQLHAFVSGIFSLKKSEAARLAMLIEKMIGNELSKPLILAELAKRDYRGNTVLDRVNKLLGKTRASLFEDFHYIDRWLLLVIKLELENLAFKGAVAKFLPRENEEGDTPLHLAIHHRSIFQIFQLLDQLVAQQANSTELFDVLKAVSIIQNKPSSTRSPTTFWYRVAHLLRSSSVDDGQILELDLFQNLFKSVIAQIIPLNPISDSLSQYRASSILFAIFSDGKKINGRRELPNVKLRLMVLDWAKTMPEVASAVAKALLEYGQQTILDHDFYVDEVGSKTPLALFELARSSKELSDNIAKIVVERVLRSYDLSICDTRYHTHMRIFDFSIATIEGLLNLAFEPNAGRLRSALIQIMPQSGGYYRYHNKTFLQILETNPNLKFAMLRLAHRYPTISSGIAHEMKAGKLAPIWCIHDCVYRDEPDEVKEFIEAAVATVETPYARSLNAGLTHPSVREAFENAPQYSDILFRLFGLHPLSKIGEFTPLFVAARNGSKEAASFLIRENAIVNKTSSGYSFLDLANYYSHRRFHARCQRSIQAWRRRRDLEVELGH